LKSKAYIENANWRSWNEHPWQHSWQQSTDLGDLSQVAEKAGSPPPAGAPRLSRGQIERAIARIKGLIEDLENFDPESVEERSDPRVDVLEGSIREALLDIFGDGTPQFQIYVAAANIDTAGINYAFQIPHAKVVEGLANGKKRALALLNQAVKSLERRLAELDDVYFQSGGTAETPAAASSDIFIVHGHDERAKVEVALVIQRAGLNPIILHEQPNAGHTLIEEFEEHGGTSGFAIAILTPDDVGGVDKDHLQPRARQNVIGEIFWFAGRLGRARVCALIKGDIELPSDFAGVGYTPMDSNGAWKAKATARTRCRRL
jgi:predicted nucleotide-binding protein